MSTVRAKFKVNQITLTEGTHWDGNRNVPCKLQTMELYPVTSGSEENKAFFASTPSGSIKLGTVNDEAAKQFELGKEYYVDFTPANADTAG